MKTQIHPVPDELRDSINKFVGEAAAESSSSSSGAVTSHESEATSSDGRCDNDQEPSSKHPYDILLQSRIDLEAYVLFLQVWQRVWFSFIHS